MIKNIKRIKNKILKNFELWSGKKNGSNWQKIISNCKLFNI